MNYAWRETIQYEETVVFVQEEPGTLPRARLLFPPEEILSITNSDGSIHWDPQNDIAIVPDAASTIELAANASIPKLTSDDLYPAIDAPNSIQKHREKECSLLFSEQDLWPNLQPRITYRHAGWDLPRPAGQAARLPHTHAKLRKSGAFSFVVFGDSISVGGNATKHVNIPPYRPPYGEQVANELAQAATADIRYANHSRGGQNSTWGLENIQPVLDATPDLAVLAWGMNDASARMAPEIYLQNIQDQMAAIRGVNPACEFVLVATMMGNPDWHASAPELYPAYRDGLQTMVGPGVAVADLTTLWGAMLTRKRFVDITGNGVNHPNDFGQHLYAQVVTHTILGEDSP